jgi:hypothetical protein
MNFKICNLKVVISIIFGLLISYPIILYYSTSSWKYNHGEIVPIPLYSAVIINIFCISLIYIIWSLLQKKK